MSLLEIRRDAESAPFFEGAGEGRLMIRRCRACSAYSDPASRRCAQCRSSEQSWHEASGRGRLVTWAVPHVKGEDGVMTPAYAIGIVELEEGPWIHVGLLADDLGAVTADQPVTVEFSQPEGGEHLPVVRA